MTFSSVLGDQTVVHDSTSVRRCTRRKQILLAAEAFVVFWGLVTVVGGWVIHQARHEPDPSISSLATGQDAILFDYGDSVLCFSANTEEIIPSTRKVPAGTAVVVVDDDQSDPDRLVRIRLAGEPCAFYARRENLRPKP